MKSLLVALSAIFVLSACDSRTPEQKEFDRTPRVIKQFDGCKTYKFEDENGSGNNWHYVTRCPNSNVTHENNWTEKQGKNTVSEQETNVTVNQ